jgi:hypothetical protein
LLVRELLSTKAQDEVVGPGALDLIDDLLGERLQTIDAFDVGAERLAALDHCDGHVPGSFTPDHRKFLFDPALPRTPILPR